MAVIQPNGDAVTSTSTKNNTGVVLHGGTIVGTKMSAQGLGSQQPNITPEGMSHVYGAISGGSYKTMRAGEYIMKRVSSSLGGVANTALLSGGADYGQRKGVHKVLSAKNAFLKGLAWVADADGQPTYTSTYVNTTSTYGSSDDATDGPGELVYSVGGVATIDQYETRVQK